VILEKAVYQRMIIRDVNNYIAIYEDGSLKTKGAYSYDLQLHQNFSGLVIAKVAQQVLLDNVDIRDTLLEEWHKDSSQFMLKIMYSYFIFFHHFISIVSFSTCSI
jgi:hypothetical protein